MPNPRPIDVIRLPGLTPYAEAYRAQLERRDAVIAGTLPEALYLLQHSPVITLGREARQQNLLCSPEKLQRDGIELHRIDRGGDVTYHGPGQLVAYPILNLKDRGLGIRQYLRLLEEIIIHTLADYGLPGERVMGLTGVWVRDAKVAAIGIGARRWVTYHGLALNIDPDMSHFAHIVPCGIADKPVTSLRALLGQAPALEEVCTRLERHFLHRFSPIA